MNNQLATKKYWEQLNRTAGITHTIPFSNLLRTFLEKKISSTRVALEIGCVPGTYLGYISKTFGYYPEGIDYVKGAANVTNATLKDFGLNAATIYEEDFLDWEPVKTYDLVCSFGFIEHFDDTLQIVDKHVNILKKDGVLILEIPNFSSGQYFLHTLLDKRNLERHNTKIMNLSFFKDIQKRHDLQTLYLGYTGGMFDFWSEDSNPNTAQKILRFAVRILAFFGRRIPLHNKYFSPFIILIAKK